ncbi:MAG TPA: hypothetical protein PLD54_00220 [Candidatus Levybacteria bacterium]|nr:hypothetical protein [Candidatus Levybacteria bacterium]
MDARFDFARLISYQQLVNAINAIEEPTNVDMIAYLTGHATSVRSLRDILNSSENCSSAQAVLIELLSSLSAEGTQTFISGYILGCYLDDQQDPRPAARNVMKGLPIRDGQRKTEDTSEYEQRLEAERRKKIKEPFLLYLRELEAGILLLCTLVRQLEENTER